VDAALGLERFDGDYRAVFLVRPLIPVMVPPANGRKAVSKLKLDLLL